MLVNAFALTGSCLAAHVDAVRTQLTQGAAASAAVVDRLHSRVDDILGVVDETVYASASTVPRA
jgi:hypothetical protein